MQKYQYQQQFPIYPDSVDSELNMRFVALENILLNTAGLAAIQGDFGSMEMIKNGMTWVLSRMCIEMDQLPQQYDSIEVGTWIEECSRLLCTRNFEISKGDRILGRATTQWALIDLETRRPLNQENYPILTNMANGTSVGIPRPGKIRPIATVTYSMQHTVVYSDIDYNGHVNSCRYAEWVLNTIPMDFVESHIMIHTDLNYLHETHVKDVVIINVNHAAERSVAEVTDGNGTALFRALFDWKAK